MENNVENAMEIGAELLEDIPKVHVVGKHTAAVIVGAAIVTGGVAYGVYRFMKYRRIKKGVVEGEIMDVDAELTE